MNEFTNIVDRQLESLLGAIHRQQESAVSQSSDTLNRGRNIY